MTAATEVRQDETTNTRRIRVELPDGDQVVAWESSDGRIGVRVSNSDHAALVVLTAEQAGLVARAVSLVSAAGRPGD